ncbi:P22 phage major capsid protein family protein [Streptomonospora salina]|uniref:Major capsid protein n=1 Tax=Streptomonospora salina TaxID=104205 RepID=A0A841EIN9_9ACTN|nr:P22 phage major capsid protein family protein [Streptomonospora salina]MBB6000220.1 hypothetical protein [Streptomonospora salina]
MAHQFLNPEVVARAALSALRNRTILGSLVYRDAEREFGGGSGDTITIRRPPSFVAKEFVRANGVELQDIRESGVKLTLDKFLDVSVSLTAEELTLDLRDMTTQVITPAMTAIADGVEERVAATLNGLPAGPTWDTADPVSTISAARMRLNKLKAPLTRRALVCSPEAAKLLLDTDIVRRADASGNGGQTLREASLGRLMGFDIYECNALPEPSTAFAFHPEACSLAVRAPALPVGEVDGSSQAFEGFAVRATRGYDITKKTNLLSFDTLIGSALINHSGDTANPLHLGMKLALPAEPAATARTKKAA